MLPVRLQPYYQDLCLALETNWKKVQKQITEDNHMPAPFPARGVSCSSSRFSWNCKRKSRFQKSLSFKSDSVVSINPVHQRVRAHQEVFIKWNEDISINKCFKKGILPYIVFHNQSKNATKRSILNIQMVANNIILSSSKTILVSF